MRWAEERWNRVVAGTLIATLLLVGCAPAAGASDTATPVAATPNRTATGLSAATRAAATPARSAAASDPVAPAPVASSGVTALALSAWTGGIDVYRAGVFTTQKTWLWCTAADIQITRNIVFHRTDHTAASQRAYFSWMRVHNKYTLPLSAGVDAQGWAAGFQHYVNAGYKLYAHKTFAEALRSAVIHLRRTNRPVGITVDHGNHAWLITGFTATADPAAGASFKITSVRVVGPLWGLQSINGYDMRPDTKLTPAQLSRYFTPWHYAPQRMLWDGKYVSVQP